MEAHLALPTSAVSLRVLLRDRGRVGLLLKFWRWQRLRVRGRGLRLLWLWLKFWRRQRVRVRGLCDRWRVVVLSCSGKVKVSVSAAEGFLPLLLCWAGVAARLLPLRDLFDDINKRVWFQVDRISRHATQRL